MTPGETMAKAAFSFEHSSDHLSVITARSGHSSEVSRLIHHAMTCVDQDVAAAIELMRKAANLLKGPHASESTAISPRALPGGLAPWQISRVKAYVADRIPDAMSLHELAAVSRLSISYFSTAFKASFGTSPYNYIVMQRVEYAKYRMRESAAPLSEIALDCGFADQAHLSRVFRRVTGTTPSKWRRFDSQSFAMQARN